MNRLLQAKIETEEIREKELYFFIKEMEKKKRRKIEDLLMLIERFLIQHEIVKAEDLMKALTVEEGLKYYKQYHIYYESKEALLRDLLNEQFKTLNQALLKDMDTFLYQSMLNSQLYFSYSLDKHFLKHTTIQPLSQLELEDLLTQPFLENHYSKRLEKIHKNFTLDTLDTLKASLKEEKTIKQTVKQCKDFLNQQDYQLERLIITEESFYFNEVNHALYEKNEIDYYQFLSTLDKKTSSQCKNMDLKVFKTTEAQIGMNKPPLHVNCRSTTIPFIEGLTEDSERAFKLDDNKTQITSNMNYHEWYKTFYKKDVKKIEKKNEN